MVKNCQDSYKTMNITINTVADTDEWLPNSLSQISSPLTDFHSPDFKSGEFSSYHVLRDGPVN